MSIDLPTALAHWESLLANAAQRGHALPQDADNALTTLIRDGQQTAPGFNLALGDLDRRVDGIEDELDAGWRDLSAVFEQAMSAAQVAGDGDEVRRLRWQRAGERRKADTLRQELAHAAQKVLVEARADAGRALHAAAARAWASPQACSACSAPIDVGAVYETTDFLCPRCRTRNRVEPSTEALAYLADDRVGALADEAVLDQLVGLEQARRRFTAWLHPLDDDFAAFETVARETWTKWAEALEPLHPGWDEARARREAARRLDETLAPWRSDSARDRRALLTRGCAQLRSGNQRETLDLAHAQPGGAVRLLEDLSVCLHEHEDRTVAWQCLALVHHAGRVTEDRDVWMRRRISELDEALCTR
jgi:hypothetical protein